MRQIATVALLLCALPATSLAKRDLKALQHRLGRLIIDKRLAGAKVGLFVQDLRSGRVLAQHDQDKIVPVASNVKLVTSSAALTLLGPNYRFQTAIYAVDREGSEVRGDLVLKGFGDPTLADADLWAMVRELRGLGIRRAAGVTIDETFFDDQRLAPLYDTSKTDMYYRPASGAISIHENAFAIGAEGAETPGRPARLLISPRSSYLRVVNRVKTAKRRSWLRIKTRPLATRTVVTVTGRVRVGQRFPPERRRIEHPGLLAGMTLRDLLVAAKIRVKRRPIERGQAPKGDPLVVHRSAPLAVIVRYMNKVSSNFVAEQLLKTLGAEVKGGPGSFTSGLTAVKGHLAQIGLTPGSYKLENGSGLYEGNRFSPRQLATVIRHTARAFRTGPDYIASLSMAGTDGTLRNRLDEKDVQGLVRAKTGTLNKVVSLSGLAGAASARGPLVFSILITELAPGRIRPARAVADEMAAALVRYLDAGP
jgi:D-alanyl-D-alanine carboxypeptidase/D-alanyl-D-alanine-endopeptidase (penicillin-binding protein 4)